MKKISLFLIALVIILSPTLYSCTDPSNIDPNDSSEEHSSISSTEPEKETEEVTNALDGLAFSGETINILEHDRSSQSAGIILAEIYSEGENGDIINDAIFRRNSLLEVRLDININPILSADVAADATKSIMAGDAAYDVINATAAAIGKILSSHDMLIDMNTLPHVDFTQAWWDQQATEELSIGNKLFLNVSASNLTALHHSSVIFFNKTLMTDNGIEHPYQLVRDGKWTLDAMQSMMKDIQPRDLNGDGVMDEQDFWGLSTENIGSPLLLAASGEKLISKDSESVLYDSLYTDRGIEVIDKIFDIVLDKSLTLIAENYRDKYSNPWIEAMLPAFTEERALFYINGISTAGTRLRNNNIDFGLIPLPKYDEQQEKYYNSIKVSFSMLQAVPATNDKLEATGAFLEMLAYESLTTVVPAYYETSIKNKFLRDEESIEMLDIVKESLCYDLGFVYNFGNISTILSGLTGQGSRDFVSEYEKSASIIKSAIDDYVSAVLK